MLISIGILAWNEAASIEKTLRSLLGQTVLQDAGGDATGHDWEIVVVPNGCTDQTAAVCRAFLSEHVTARMASKVSWRVDEIKEGGKSNAWNRYIHDFSSPAAELIVLMDADIEFGESETIERTVEALTRDAHAAAAVDWPLKDALKKPKKTLIERISVTASATVGSGRVALCGQFFCARSAVLRRIWMPKGLPVEDGFLGAMISTDCMISPWDNGRIIRAEKTSHYYQTLNSVGAILRHELRLVMGTALNAYFISDFLSFAIDPQGPGAGALIRHQMNRDPEWFAKFIRNTIRTRGWWVIPRGMLLGRFFWGDAATRRKRRLRWLIFTICVFWLHLSILLVANRRLKKHSSIGFW